MAILKLIRGEYRNSDAIKNLVNYILDINKMPSRCWGGIGVPMGNPVDAMYRIKNVFDKTAGKQAEHFVLAFDSREAENLSPYFMTEIAYEICVFFKNVQVIFAVHEVKNTYISDDYCDNCVHIHFVLNTVNVQNVSAVRIGRRTQDRGNGIIDRRATLCILNNEL